MSKKQKLKTYRVYVAQVNQTYVLVKARDVDDASEKGYAKWRRTYGSSYVIAVERDEDEAARP